MKRKKRTDKKPNVSSEQRSLRFFKIDCAWYADVQNHTLAENLMVQGADKLIESVSGGKREVTVSLAWPNYDGNEWLFRLDRIDHNAHGATYSVTPSDAAKSAASAANIPIVPKAWICNVTHDVLGGHPTSIYILSAKAE